MEENHKNKQINRVFQLFGTTRSDPYCSVKFFIKQTLQKELTYCRGRSQKQEYC